MIITITEALAEIKTIGKRVESKQQFIRGYLARPDAVKDPLEKDGGSLSAIERERQAISDLQSRVVMLRRAIQEANRATLVTINGSTQSIADWLVWRREVAPVRQTFLAMLRSAINQIRGEANRQGITVVGPTASAEKPTDVIISINEKELAEEIEQLENTLGQLDGMLSLKNATVMLAD